MHIAFVAHNFVRGDGQGRIQYEVVRHALSAGHHVTLGADNVAPDLLEHGATWQPVRKRPNRPNLLGVRTFGIAADRWVRRQRSDYDVVVGAGYTLAERHDVNLCQFVHGAWAKSPVHTAKLNRGPYAWYQAAYTRANHRWERRAYANAGCVVAPSEKIKAELLGIGVPNGRVRVIYNGVDLREFVPRAAYAADPAGRTALGLPSQGTLALFVGDIRTPRKNLDSVLKALVGVPGLNLAVVGALPGSPFPALARQLGLSDRVIFTGFRRDVGAIMRAADLFVFPSRYEAGTLVLIEALATGLPTITARTAGGCEIIGPDCGTVLDDPDDLAGLTTALSRWSVDTRGREIAAVAARRTAEQHSWSSMATSYLELFEQAALDRTAPRAQKHAGEAA